MTCTTISKIFTATYRSPSSENILYCNQPQLKLIYAFLHKAEVYILLWEWCKAKGIYDCQAGSIVLKLE